MIGSSFEQWDVGAGGSWVVGVSVVDSFEFCLIYFIWRPALKPSLHISRNDRKHMFENMLFKLYRYGLISTSLSSSQLLIFRKIYLESFERYTWSRYVESFKISFGALLQTSSTIVTNIWRPELSLVSI